MCGEDLEDVCISVQWWPQNSFEVLQLSPSVLQVARLHGYDSFLQQALSSKGIDIRKREAEALRARIERELAGVCVCVCVRISMKSALNGDY
jgi:hypothetical protein